MFRPDVGVTDKPVTLWMKWWTFILLVKTPKVCDLLLLWINPVEEKWSREICKESLRVWALPWHSSKLHQQEGSKVTVQTQACRRNHSDAQRTVSSSPHLRSADFYIMLIDDINRTNYFLQCSEDLTHIIWHRDTITPSNFILQFIVSDLEQCDME